MALSKENKVNIYGKTLIFPNSYVQITEIYGGKEKITMQVATYTDNLKEYLLSNEVYDFIPDVCEDSENFIKQGYLYLKALDKFKDAVDIFE